MVKKLGEYKSVCPECLGVIVGEKYIENDEVVLEKKCEEHGVFKTVTSRNSDFYLGMEDFEVDRTKPTSPKTIREEGCPMDCGLCNEHKQHTCIAVLEVTENCDMNCSICFADSKKGGDYYEPSLDQIRDMFETVKERSDGSSLVQISGGEPTIRDDLPEIIRMGREIGIDHIELNTNGVRIARDPEFFKKICDEGIDSLYLSFDGVSDNVYEKRYGKPLLEEKVKAIERAAEAGVGVVLVPTVAKGYNINEVGEIVDFAKELIPAVKGVHFQPVSLFGRSPSWLDEDSRVTLWETAKAIENQTEGQIGVKNFTPTSCPSVHCDVSCLAILDENDEFLPLTDKTLGASGQVGDIAEKTKSSVENRWKGSRCGCESDPQELLDTMSSDDSCCEAGGWEDFVRRAMENYLTISIMDFQDAWTHETNRTEKCCIHVVVPDGRMIPFCNFNLTNKNGESLYREKIYSKYRD
ncbi:radical SAM (seleno)protein TrsS [Methanonatronarchaeum sp. AMET-Sl]|uniref:radical SAM (seleno)protein TrsS n=1 Tax=Methanonatronarchaeum sp. AMET-Sl TaxID=3037654 RepID=UPI00244E4477|nr:radical SAM (seleno)protein TrsS [Methanonatronarchaeum sp. AMET-Sl]WGI17454.1 radical SAM protein [Methanonatronarchaeum sp. AMET-Sl]